MTAADFEIIALRLVPKGHERSRGDLRNAIAFTLATEVEKQKAELALQAFEAKAS